MELTRRFVFRGNASAYGGQIYRRQDMALRKAVTLVTGATSSLTVLGGDSSGNSTAARFLDGFVRVGKAGTFATAAFDDFKQAVLMSRGELAQEKLTATTRVGAWVEGVEMGGKGPAELRGLQPVESRKEPRLRVGYVGGSLTSASARDGNEPQIKLGRDSDIKDVWIDGYQLKVTLNKAEFEALDTMSKLHAASVDPTFIEKTGDCLFRAERAAVAAASTRPASVLQGTLVKSLAWAKKPHPTATIDHNSVKVPDFGVVYFGEIFVSEESRRVTMLRVQFGSPVGGAFACSEYETNGSWYPPMI